ncbi:MAG: diguanylate cyclase [Cyanobacteria bacterium J06636_16]
MASLAIVCITLLTPFAINNFIQGRFLLGIGATIIISIFAFNAWTITRYKRYSSAITGFGLIPAILFFLALSIHNQGMIGVLWCYPAVISFYFMMPERQAWVANIALLLIAIPSTLSSIEQALATRIIATLTMTSVFSAIFISVITDQQQQLRVQAATDPLTGTLNRTLLQDILEQAIQQNNRMDIPMTLLAFDIDHFKKINDGLGHDTGDIVLQQFAELLLTRCRKVDHVFRIGGEEFIVFLYNTGVEAGEQVADELRQKLESLKILPGWTVTVSVGVATLQSSETWQAWMKRSDDNLYRAKSSGRNRVVV